MKEQIILWCENEKVAMDHLSAYQCRLIKNLIMVDVYWKGERYHIIRHTDADMVQQRGDIIDADIFLESVFNNF